MGIEPKGKTKVKRRMKDLLLAASKENTCDLSQSSKIGEVLSPFMKGLGWWTESKLQLIKITRVRKSQHYPLGDI